MKKIISGFLCVVTVVVALFSCSKSADNAATLTQQVTIDTSLSSGSLFSLALGSYGNKAVISKQAADYATSAIVQSASSPVYQFSSSAKAAVTQQVTLTVTDSSKCNKASLKTTLVTLNLNVQ